MLDFPDPLGPTIDVIAVENCNSVLRAKDLNPESSIDFSRILFIISYPDALVGAPSTASELYQKKWRVVLAISKKKKSMVLTTRGLRVPPELQPVRLLV